MNTMTQWDDDQWAGQRPSNPVSIRTGTPEGRFLATSGKPLSRHASELREQVASALARFTGATSAVQYAIRRAQAQQAQHRGGNRPWPLHAVIPVAIVAEVLTAFVAMEELVSSFLLAMSLAIMAALVGACIAAMIANRRLNALPVPPSARILEGLFVAVLTLLRFESLDVQSGDFGASLGGAALAALISAIALLAIEEVLVETETCSIFLSRVRLRWRRWHCARAASRLTRAQTRVEVAGDRFHQHFLGFLVQSEGLSPAEAQRRAHALRAVLFSTAALFSHAAAVSHAEPATTPATVTDPGNMR
ncbi:MAG: hypothetical protein ACRDPO_01690 [Streptosporangiaceae bacterium]